MASPRLADIPYFLNAYSMGIINRRARKLRATANPGIFSANAAQNEAHRTAMGKFCTVLTDENPAQFRSKALPLKEAVKGGAKPEDCSLSIALSGGGLRVVAFLSFLEVMREHSIPITAYAGTSAGALAAMFDRVGVDYDTVWKCLDEKMLKALLFAPNVPYLGKGLLSGVRMIRFIDKLLPRGISTYNDVPGLYTTAVLVNSWSNMADLNESIKDGIQASSDSSFSTYRPVVFSSEYDTDALVSRGVFASMCLPVFQAIECHERTFTAIKEDGTTQKVMTAKGGWLMDGGYMNNYPVDILLHSGKAARGGNQATHIVINVVAEQPDKTHLVQDTVKKLVYFGPDTAFTSELRRERTEYSDKNIIWWTIGGEAAGVGLFDFQKIDAMKRAGRESAEALLRTVGIIS